MALVGVGAGVALLLLSSPLGITSNLGPQGTTSKGPVEATSAARSSSPGTGTIRVKARYFQMSQVVQTGEENFTIQPPAHFSDLLAEVVSKHPSVNTMIPSMMILVDGIPAGPSTTLENGDEVDFIPAIAGG